MTTCAGDEVGAHAPQRQTSSGHQFAPKMTLIRSRKTWPDQFVDHHRAARAVAARPHDRWHRCRAGAAFGPTTIMKSGAASDRGDRSQENRSSGMAGEPITVLKPVGLPPTSRTRPIMSSRSPLLRMSG